MLRERRRAPRTSRRIAALVAAACAAATLAACGIKGPLKRVDATGAPSTAPAPVSPSENEKTRLP